MKMNLEAIKRERIYVGMLFFILLFSLSFIGKGYLSKKRAQFSSPREKETVLLERAEIEKILKERTAEGKTFRIYSFGLFSFFILIAFLIGLFLDFFSLSSKRRRKSSLRNPLFPQIDWEISDLFRAGLFLCFFLSLLLFLETFLPASFFSSFDSFLLLALFNTILCEIATFLFVFCFLIKRCGRSKGQLAAFLSPGKKKAREIGLGIRSYLHLLPILFFSTLLIGLVTKLFGYFPQERTFSTLLLQIKSPLLLCFFGVSAVIFAPIFEEFLFRGFAYSSLRRKFGAKRGIFFSSFLFALVHRSLYSFLPIFILGIALAWLYERTGSLIPSISLHCLNNGIASIFFLSLRPLL